MTEQIFQYAEELMQYQQENDLHGDTLEQKVIRLNEQFSIVSTHCMPVNYVAAIDTKKTGIIGKIVVLMKRLVRKATFYIIRDLTFEIANFERDMLNIFGNMIELQEEIIVELIDLKKTSAENTNKDHSSRG